VIPSLPRDKINSLSPSVGVGLRYWPRSIVRMQRSAQRALIAWAYISMETYLHPRKGKTGT
jgi:hypothetical protein